MQVLMYVCNECRIQQSHKTELVTLVTGHRWTFARSSKFSTTFVEYKQRATYVPEIHMYVHMYKYTYTCVHGMRRQFLITDARWSKCITTRDQAIPLNPHIPTRCRAIRQT